MMDPSIRYVTWGEFPSSCFYEDYQHICFVGSVTTFAQDWHSKARHLQRHGGISAL